MPSAFSWPVLVPCALRAPAPVNLGVSHLKMVGTAVSSREVWKTESRVGRQSLAAAGMCAVGLTLVIWLRNFEGPGLTDSRAGFLLGILLLVIGVGMLVSGGKQVIVVEPRSRRVIVERASLLGIKRTEVQFAEITSVEVEELGDTEGGSISYHLSVRLKSGKELPLFLGFFEGSHSKTAMEARREKLLSFLRTAG